MAAPLLRRLLKMHVCMHCHQPSRGLFAAWMGGAARLSVQDSASSRGGAVNHAKGEEYREELRPFSRAGSLSARVLALCVPLSCARRFSEKPRSPAESRPCLDIRHSGGKVLPEQLSLKGVRFHVAAAGLGLWGVTLAPIGFCKQQKIHVCTVSQPSAGCSNGMDGRRGPARWACKTPLAQGAARLTTRNTAPLA